MPDFFKRTNQPQHYQNFKNTYYKLIPFLEINEIDAEITEKLDAIHELLQ
jgi:Zn-dependent peptidase ImmA (M78 family)